jgi:two-component system OmpR family response regulator/two-component system response regulator RstA
MPSVFLVEDDKRLSQLMADYLREHQFLVTTFSDEKNVMPQLRRHPPDLILLDVMLPGKDGFQLCRELRSIYSGPILFLTARSDNFDQVLGLELGADDYMIKPVEPRVMLARVQAALRRAAPATHTAPEPTQLRFGGLFIDKAARHVELADEMVELTSHEFDLLWLLATHASNVVTRDTIYDTIIGREYDGLDRSADVRISRLRKKLHDNQKNPYRIKTIWGKGFYFVADAWDGYTP